MAMPQHSEAPLTQKELAAATGKSIGTIRLWRLAGMPYVKVGDGRKYYLLTEVLSWLKEHREATVTG